MAERIQIKPKQKFILENVDNIRKWKSENYSDAFISKALNVSSATWNEAKKNPIVLKALNDGAIEYREKNIKNISEIREATIKKAKGFFYEEIRQTYKLKGVNKQEITNINNLEDNKKYDVKIEKIKRYCPPDPFAAEKALYFLGDEEIQSRQEQKLKLQKFKLEKNLLEKGHDVPKISITNNIPLKEEEEDV